MCKILDETLEGEKCKGFGFFCEIDNFPIKYALFTNNHVLDELNIEIGNTINFEYLENDNIFQKKIKIEENRNVFTNEELDYTCIELFESDGITDYLKIDLLKYDDNNLKDNDLFILNYPNGNDLSFSYGKILLTNDDIIRLSVSIGNGSSGSPIIKRSKDNYIIGLHGYKKKINLATKFDSILINIKEIYYNEINCIYIPKNNEKKIFLLHNDNSDTNEMYFDENAEEKMETEIINTKLFEKKIDIYINDKKIKFDFQYEVKDEKEIKVKFKFKTLLTNTSFMFCNCSSLKTIDLSSFNTNKVTNMSWMFFNCSSLKSIDLSSFNTNKVTNMSYMFSQCSSLELIDLSSFNTNNVTNMMGMFYRCLALELIDLSSFNTNKVTNMSIMFSNCSSLKSIDLSSFNTNNVTDMGSMFSKCSSLESIDLSSFNTNNVTNLRYMFSGCSSLKKENIIIKNKNDKLLEEIN